MQSLTSSLTYYLTQSRIQSYQAYKALSLANALTSSVAFSSLNPLWSHQLPCCSLTTPGTLLFQRLGICCSLIWNLSDNTSLTPSLHSRLHSTLLFKCPPPQRGLPWLPSEKGLPFGLHPLHLTLISQSANYYQTCYIWICYSDLLIGAETSLVYLLWLRTWLVHSWCFVNIYWIKWSINKCIFTEHLAQEGT